MARTFRNLHPQVCSLENVMAAARSAMQGEMSGHAAARFHARWETHAVQLHEEHAVPGSGSSRMSRAVPETPSVE